MSAVSSRFLGALQPALGKERHFALGAGRMRTHSERQCLSRCRKEVPTLEIAIALKSPLRTSQLTAISITVDKYHSFEAQLLGFQFGQLLLGLRTQLANATITAMTIIRVSIAE